jgi:UPF0113 Pre-PUA domain
VSSILSAGRPTTPHVRSAGSAMSSRLQELQQVLEKLVKFIGKNVRNVVEREDEKYCFRLHKNRVYYVRETLVKKATNVRLQLHPCTHHLTSGF